MSEQETLTQDFEPTKAMRRYAEACLRSEVAPNDEARCEEAKIRERTLYRWRKNPAFEPWLCEEVTRLLKVRMWEIWASTYRLACAGNFPAARLLILRFAPETEAEEADPPDFATLTLAADREGWFDDEDTAEASE